MKFDESIEYSGFHEVACKVCGQVTSVKIDSWMVFVREEVIVKADIKPSMFECPRCHSALKVKAVFELNLETVTESELVQDAKQGVILHLVKKKGGV